jgi:RNA polymerase sigma factor (sigma-70 family)
MAHETTSASAVDQYFNTMGRFELLKPSAIIELSRKVQAWQTHPNGPADCSPIIKRLGIAARDKMVRHNMRLVVKIWNDKYSVRVPMGNAGLADMLQRATCDLIRAAEKFDPTKGHTFSTYATTWIHKGMKSYLADEERLVRIPSNNYFLVKAALLIQSNRTSAGLPEFTTEELVEDMSKTRRNMPSAKLLGEWIDAYNATNARSFSERVSDDTELGDLVAITKNDESSDDIIVERAREAMAYLTSFERDVLAARFGKKRGTVGHAKVAKLLKSTTDEVALAETRAIKRIKTIALSR